MRKYIPNEDKLLTREGELLVKIILGVIIVGGVIILLNPLFIIGAGERGVIFNKLSGVKSIAYGEGIHIRIPLIEKVYRYEVRTKIYSVEATAASKDLQNVHTNLALNYHVNPNGVSILFQTIGMDYEGRIIAPTIQEIVKATTAKYPAEELITRRETVKEDIKYTLKERLAQSNIISDEVSITNFEFDPEFTKAIEQKVVAEQNALKEQNNLRVVEFQAQQKVKAAEGEAQAIKVINEELRKSPQYVNLLMIQKWDGKMPLALGSNTLLSITGNTQTEIK